jgi:hypothetical protein
MADLAMRSTVPNTESGSRTLLPPRRGHTHADKDNDEGCTDNDGDNGEGRTDNDEGCAINIEGSTTMRAPSSGTYLILILFSFN